MERIVERPKSIDQILDGGIDFTVCKLCSVLLSAEFIYLHFITLFGEIQTALLVRDIAKVNPRWCFHQYLLNFSVNLPTLYTLKATAAALPNPTSACWVFLYIILCKPPNSDMDYRIVNVHT